jgi:iron complex outermembrane receptor protein
MRTPDHALTALALAALLQVSFATAVAQTPSATLEINVRTSLEDRPLPGAQVFVEGLGMRGITDRNGTARITGLPTGARRIEVRYLGYAPVNELLALAIGRTTRVTARLDFQPIQLTEVTVRVRQSRLAENGFFERREHGLGTFFTRDEIEQMRPRFLTDVIHRVPGLQIPSLLTPRRTARIRGSSPTCTIQFVINGIATSPGFQLDYVPPGDVEGMEIYKGAATVPAMFNRTTSACGTIVIWTRTE